MATIPEKPQTNLEQYLNRIATGDGDYPAKPRTNVEQYLNYIIEEGVGAGSELVTELPEEGKDGALYVLVDNAEHPTKAYGVYTYAGGSFVLAAQPVDQSVQKVDQLPQTGQEGVLYYVLKSGSTDTYDLYRWINDDWVKVDTDIVLYAQEGSNTDGAMTQAAATAMKGLARELTADDYNFHTSGDTDNRIALWLLPPGIYRWNRDLNRNILLTRNKSVASSGYGMGAIIMDGDPSKPILLFNESSQGFGLNYWQVGGDGYYGSGKWVSFALVDNLTTDHGYEALSAKQGKVLKDSIGDLTNLTTTDKTDLVAAINEAAAGGGGGGGEAKELTAADYNYPTDNPDSVALWLMPAGMYVKNDSNVLVREQSSSYVGLGSFIVLPHSGSSQTTIIRVSEGVPGTVAKVLVNSSNGSAVSGSGDFLTGTIAQSTGTSTTDVMSQNAVTSMVFADPAVKDKVQIGRGANASGNDSVCVGTGGSASGSYSTALGRNAVALGAQSVAIGAYTSNQVNGTVAIGGNGVSGRGYNNSDYRLLTGLYDGQSAHDAATYGQLSTAIINGGTTAPTTSTVGAVGTLYSYVDTSGQTPEPHLVVCTAVSGNTYTWTDLLSGIATALQTLNQGTGY